MAVKKKAFWLGEKVGRRRVGKIGIDGKNYAIGAEIPADKIDKDRLAMFRKSGCIGDAAFDFVGSAPDDAKDKDIALLQGKLSEAMAKAKEDGDKIAGLELDLEAATEGMVLYPGGEKVTFDYLRDECTRLTAEVKEAADLKAVHVQAHADAAKEPAKTEKKDDKK